jgi:hypothetical protein
VKLTSTDPLNSIQVTTTGEFSETDNCSGVPSTSCTINVNFTPTDPGNITGTLNVNTGLTSPISIGLSGIGTVVPFAAFNPRLNIYDKSSFGFHVRGPFILGTGSNGIDPTSEAITLTIGAFSITIPAGSFKQDLSFSNKTGTGYISSKEGKFYYHGQIDNVDLEMKIASEGQKESEYKFEAKGTGTDLTTLENSPEIVSLLIGDNMGKATINPVGHCNSDKDEKDDDRDGGNHDQH